MNERVNVCLNACLLYPSQSVRDAHPAFQAVACPLPPPFIHFFLRWCAGAAPASPATVCISLQTHRQRCHSGSHKLAKMCKVTRDSIQEEAGNISWNSAACLDFHSFILSPVSSSIHPSIHRPPSCMITQPNVSNCTRPSVRSMFAHLSSHPLPIYPSFCALAHVFISPLSCLSILPICPLSAIILHTH